MRKQPNEVNQLISDKLLILKNYIYILSNSKQYNENYKLAISYFMILHNFLIIEQKFFEDVKISNKEININLLLENINNEIDIYNTFIALYDVNNIIRNNIETLDSIESVRIYFSKNQKIFTELLY